MGSDTSERRGGDGNVFVMLEWRTMRLGDETTGTAAMGKPNKEARMRRSLSMVLVLPCPIYLSSKVIDVLYYLLFFFSNSIG